MKHDPGKRADEPLNKVKPAGPVREVRNNERSQHTQGRTAASVEHLNDDKQGRSVVKGNSPERIGTAASPSNRSGRRPRVAAVRPPNTRAVQQRYG